jgi:phosphate/sulfate permease
MFVKLSRYLPGNPFLQGPSSMFNTKSTNIAIIISPMLGGILALVIIICLIVFIQRKSHNKTKERTLASGHLEMMKAVRAGK